MPLVCGDLFLLSSLIMFDDSVIVIPLKSEVSLLVICILASRLSSWHESVLASSCFSVWFRSPCLYCFLFHIEHLSSTISFRYLGLFFRLHGVALRIHWLCLFNVLGLHCSGFVTIASSYMTIIEKGDACACVRSSLNSVLSMLLFLVLIS